MSSIAIADITIHREDRQRRVLDDIDTLASSISRNGLYHPVIIDENYILIAGERRLTACKKLGWTHIPVQFFNDLSNSTKLLIELEENIIRKDISWQERTTAIAKYHELRASENPNWSIEQTAQELDRTPQHVYRNLVVARELSSPLVQQATTFVTALERAKTVGRKRDDLLHTLTSCENTHQIITADFIQWAQQPQEKFNFIHCDFPYGIAAHESGQNPAGYYDSDDVYRQLFNALTSNLDHFCAPDAHMIFWFASTFYSNTWEMLKLLDGFKFDDTPLIWFKSDNAGVIPDHTRRPRRVYEMAFFGWRGEARINAVRANLFAAPTERSLHPHEKSQAMLEHFFSMFVDEHTRLLDPTAGSGSSLRAARRLGATTIIGIEKSEEFADVARRALREAGNSGTKAGGDGS